MAARNFRERRHPACNRHNRVVFRLSSAVDKRIEIRQVKTIEEYDACVHLQREVFGLPDLEISPRRHLIVSEQAGGWTLAAFIDGKLVGFVHHLAAVRGE